jgi:hypothetical protein
MPLYAVYYHTVLNLEPAFDFGAVAEIRFGSDKVRVVPKTSCREGFDATGTTQDSAAANLAAQLEH